MKQSSLISIIVPAYNAEKWIEQACRSVFEQTYENWELIVVDDGSKDRTFELLTALSKQQPKLRVIHTENGGVCRARNTGLEAAKGEYIGFLDADDCMMPHALEVLARGLEENEADMSIGWKTNMTSSEEDLGCPYRIEAAVLEGKQAVEYALRDHPSMYAVWGKLYRRELLRDLRFVEGRKIHEDSFFVFQCCLKEPKTVILDEIVLRYRVSENSASRSAFSEKYFDILYFANEKRRIVNQRYPEFHALAENTVLKANITMLNNLRKSRDKKYRQQEKACIREVIRKKQYYIAAIPGEERFFRIIIHHMYYPYKFLKQMFQ